MCAQAQDVSNGGGSEKFGFSDFVHVFMVHYTLHTTADPHSPTNAKLRHDICYGF